MSVDIEKLEELTKAITPLPWRHIDKGHFYVTDANPNREIAKIGMVPRAYAKNAEYIAAACNAVPELIERERKLKEKLEKRTNQLLLLVDKYADIISCKYCPLYNECTADEQIDADPIICGVNITEWLEKAIEESQNAS